MNTTLVVALLPLVFLEPMVLYRVAVRYR